MGNKCHDLCNAYEKATNFHKDYYKDDRKFCRTCGIAYVPPKCNKFICLCCGNKLRSRQRRNKQIEWQKYRLLLPKLIKKCEICGSDTTKTRFNKKRNKFYPDWHKILGVGDKYSCASCYGKTKYRNMKKLAIEKWLTIK